MDLGGRRVAILVERDFQDMEVLYPYYRFREAGAQVVAVGVDAVEYKGKFGYPIKAEKRASEVAAKDLDAVVVPGGWAPDFLRRDQAMKDLVGDAHAQGKVIAAICHGGWLLCSVKGLLAGRRVTSFSAIRDDVENAGAQWLDAEVVVDRNLITSRKPDDLPAFCRAIGQALSAVAARR